MLRVRRQIGCSDELLDTCRGSGVTVAMLDTGVAPHPDFENRVIAFADFVNERRTGTMTAGMEPMLPGVCAVVDVYQGGAIRELRLTVFWWRERFLIIRGTEY